MKSLSGPACLFCEAQPALPGELYCCEGCKVLDQVRDQASKGPVLKIAQEQTHLDFDLKKNFAELKGNKSVFHCRVDPLACETCLQSLAVMSEQFTGLQDLKWDRERSILSFAFDGDNFFPSSIFAHLKKLNLNPHWLSLDSLKQQNQSERKQKLLRIGLTGAFAGNIMLFAVPIYGGLQGALQTIFEWIQFAFFLPVFFWSAQPFYRTAWISLRTRILSVDLPLTIAFVVGSLFSFTNLLLGNHDLYFDSLAGFFFLILSSRYLLESSIEKYLIRPQLSDFFEKALYTIRRQYKDQTQPLNVTWNQLQPGDIMTLNRTDRLPVDGKLLNRGAEFETAWLTGENLPVLRLYGSEILAGSKLISNQAEVEVTKSANETEFAKLIGHLEPGFEKLRVTSEAKIGAFLVAACFLCVLGLFAFLPELGLNELLRRSIAVFIVACPCAISFAAPLARARANRLARQHGFWVRDNEVWSKLIHAKKIAFDKTGTLTSGQLRLARHSPLIDTHWKKIILSLENISQHPIAESLRKSWGEMDLFAVEDAEEILGLGVQGKILGHNYQLKKSTDENTNVHLNLYQDNEKVLELSLEEDAQPRLQTALEYFLKFYSIFIISGDREHKVKAFAQKHKLSSDQAFGDLNPQEKLLKIKEIQPDLYFGDGTNDILALKNAPISVATLGASTEAQAASDILMLNSDIADFYKIFEVALEVQKINRRNTRLALTYNFASAVAALLGWVHPLMAAILMPIASVSLLLSTQFATKKIRLWEKKR